MEAVSRRRALAGAGLVGVAAPVLAACGDDGGDSGRGAAGSPSSSSGTPETASSSATPSDETAATDAPQVEGLVATADVPVGGGVILDDPALVVTQPARGDFRAFSSTCTHRGCTVTTVLEGTINCRCHGSRFSIEDGSVQGGPAPAPLTATEVEVEGGQVVRA